MRAAVPVLLLSVLSIASALRVPPPPLPSTTLKKRGSTSSPTATTTLTAAALSFTAPMSAFAATLASEAAAMETPTFEPRGITPEDSVIFVIGCVPFVWAAIEFWTRIANGDSFGTGKDSVVIQPLGQQYEGNKRVLGQDAMIAARILFALAFASGVLVLIAGADILQGV